jgi:hypothetical protein
MQDVFGFLGTTNGTGAGISGCLDAGSTRLGRGLCGFPSAGCLAARAMPTPPDIGGNAYQTGPLDFTRDRHEAISTAWHS